MKYTIKIKYNIIRILICIILINMININIVVADTSKQYIIADTQTEDSTDTETKESTKADWKEGFELGDKFIQSGAKNSDINEEQLRTDASGIYNILVSIGSALTVIVGAILGIAFMMSSAEDKAKIKEMMIPYVVGCVVIFSSFGIWKIVVDMGDTINSSSQQEYNDGKVDYTRQNNSEKIQDIEQGNMDLSSLSDNEIKNLYRSNGIDSDLNEKVNGTRNRNRKTLSQAINELSSTKKKIYQEAKKRKLIKEDGGADDGIWLK